jgi:hypothetical protein
MRSSDIDSTGAAVSNDGVSIRRAAAWISTAMVAIVVALAVPVSQLRIVSVVKACCCPDPAQCRCPDHKADPSAPPSMRACHQTERVSVTPQMPAFHPPVVAVVMAPAVARTAVDHVMPAPHPAPPPLRPDAPS